jgi:hypothetical protein
MLGMLFLHKCSWFQHLNPSFLSWVSIAFVVKMLDSFSELKAFLNSKFSNTQIT